MLKVGKTNALPQAIQPRNRQDLSPKYFLRIEGSSKLRLVYQADPSSSPELPGSLQQSQIRANFPGWWCWNNGLAPSMGWCALSLPGGWNPPLLLCCSGLETPEWGSDPTLSVGGSSTATISLLLPSRCTCTRGSPFLCLLSSSVLLLINSQISCTSTGFSS